MSRFKRIITGKFYWELKFESKIWKLLMIMPKDFNLYRGKNTTSKTLNRVTKQFIMTQKHGYLKELSVREMIKWSLERGRVPIIEFVPIEEYLKSLEEKTALHKENLDKK